MFTPLGLDHVVLTVRDQERSKKFYLDVLGCSVDHYNEKIRLLQLRFGEHLIDLLPATTEAEVAPKGGLDHFCLSIQCEDIDKLADQLRKRGVAIDGKIVPRRGAYGEGPSLYIRDPDGYRIELKPF